MLAGLSLAVLAPAFVIAALVVWFASVRLSDDAELLSDRWGLGQALGGLVLLAIVEDLPELVIVVSGSLKGHLDLITGNLLGGIATQTLLLAAVDAAGVPDRPLTYRSSSVQVLLDGLQGMVVYGLVVMCTQLPAGVHAIRLSPGAILIPLAWVTTTWLINRARRGLSWHEEDSEPPPASVRREHQRREQKQSRTGTGKAVATFSASALAILIAGYALEESGNAMAGDLGINGVVFGATILALATGLPEFTAAYEAAKGGSFELAVSGVLGSNAFLPVLFLPAVLISGRAILPGAGPENIYLTGLGMVLTSVYLWGFFFRPRRQIWRLGPDSIVVIGLYLVGIGGLIVISNS